MFVWWSPLAAHKTFLYLLIWICFSTAAGEKIKREHKDTDRFRGKVAEDTGITSLFAGPRVIGSWGQWSAEGRAVCRYQSIRRRCK